MKRQTYLFIGLTLLFLIPASSAFATTGLPWETPITTLTNSLTGPIAFGVALIAIFATGGMLIFGGELNDFTKRGSYVVLVLGLLVAANTALSTLFPNVTGSGAVI